MTIYIPQPTRGHAIVDTIVNLEKLRTKILAGDVPPYIFFQLKSIFHKLETLGSARIEGNNTTLAEYVEDSIRNFTDSKKTSSKQELYNLEQAIKYIEEGTLTDTLITRKYISDLHILVTQNLPSPPVGEGSYCPGSRRSHNVQIKNSSHIPPDYIMVPDCMEELFDFINRPYPEKDQLLMIAITHHRFAYIHPFDNGNGRIGRLLNYALLIKLGFQVKQGRLFNPSAVFYTDRNLYYNKLGLADSLSDQHILDWSNYFLVGLKNEIEKVDILLQKKYVTKKILLPSLIIALENKIITDDEYKILYHIVESSQMQVKSEDLDVLLGIKNSVSKSRFMSKMKNKGILKTIKKDGRIYTINFENNYLLRSIIQTLYKEGFVADFLNNN